jgi:hypothetical protein
MVTEPDRHSQLQNLRNERLTFLDATLLSTMNLEDLVPLEVDDEMILENGIISQPKIGLSLTTGFNIHSRIFWAALIPLLPRESAAVKKLPCSCVRSADPMLQLAYLEDRLHDLKYMLDNIPPQLRQWVAEDDDDALYGSSPEQQRIVKAQFATMRANIHVTHLWLQSLIRDQVDALLLGQPNPPDLKSTWSEREDICRQFLHVLHSIPHISLEPNGLHFVCFPSPSRFVRDLE